MTYNISQYIANSKLDKSDSKLILRHILNFTPAQLIIHNEYILSTIEFERAEELSCKRLEGVPMHYLLGQKEFYSRQFKVTPGTLIPRPETELLVDTVLKLVNNSGNLLDLGTGSGCIAISLKLECPQLQVEAVDKYHAALDVAQENAFLLDADIDLYLSDWFTSVRGKYDIIISNPPYIHPEDKHLKALCFEPQTALTDYNDGLDCLRHIIKVAPDYLNSNGYLMVEHSFDQGNAVRGLFATAGFKQIQTIQDYSDNDRITLGMKNE